MKRLLDINNPVIRNIIKVFDCMVLSVLWVVFSLPIVTMGAASTALYASVYHYIRKDEGYLWKTFWTAFKENFKRSTLSWLPLLAMILFLIYDLMALRVMIKSGHPLGRLFGIILALLFVAAVWSVYLAAYCARFQGGVKDMLRFSFYLIMQHPLRSLAVMLAVVGSAVLILIIPGLLALLPAVAFWISSTFVEQVFLLHMRPEDIQKIKDEEGNA
ncbi:MAG: YesL family protein [Lachnospiraceae bacterium]|nr:YesL family protein [Lachnospiraceae bacterium]